MKLHPTNQQNKMDLQDSLFDLKEI